MFYSERGEGAWVTTETPLLEAKGVTKYFGAITALRNVNFHVNAGEALGVVGDNGAGKSTLMKILSGLYQPSEGQLIFEGRPVHFSSPRIARNIGIEMVYQDFALAGNLPIYENIYLGREPGSRLGGLTVIDKAKEREMAQAHLDKLKIHVKSVDQPVEELSGGRPSPSRAPPPSMPRSSSWTSRRRRSPSRKSARSSISSRR
jgi:simple sugar transport system ATP-binding protein